MIYRLLGDLEIGESGASLSLPGGVTLVLLAVLLANANRPMSAAELIRAGWGEPDVAIAQLHKRISAIRQLLAQIGRGEDLTTHHGFGYELRALDSDVDARQFQFLVQEASAAEAGHRTDDEIAALRQALALWRGPHPLSNVPANALSQEIAALEQRRRRAAARLFSVELALGNHEGVLDELIVMARAYPSDRRLCEQLMVAAYRCGHVTDVADAYERYQAALAEQTGAAPDPLLRTLHFAVARGDDVEAARAASAIAGRAGTSARPVIAVPRQLPRPVDLVGRDDLVAEVRWLLRREPRAAPPVVVISGPGGIGKTALAVRAAHGASDWYPDGQLYAELRGTAGGAADVSEVAAQFLRALGMPRVPDSRAERLGAYRTLLAGRRVLIVLDDAADEAQVSDLIPAAPGCAVLVTARRRLPGITGCHHVPALEPLLPADATELFLRVARDAGISLEEDLDAAGRVVALCGGLPLALRIAGALCVQAHPRPAAELASRLARQGPAGFSYGNLDLARTIGAGLDRLGPAARRLFLELGSLQLASFGDWTASALLDGDSGDPAGALLQLAAGFMIEPTERGLRYRFHDLTREYALRRAQAEHPGGSSQVPARVYGALLTLARHAHRRLYGGDFEVIHSSVPDWAAPPAVLAEIDAAPLDWFERERANIRAAVGHCAALGLTGTCWDLAVSSHEFYSVRSYVDDWQATHAAALGACRQAGDRRGEGIVLACQGQPTLVASRRAGQGAAAGLRQAVSLLADCGDRHGQAIALRTLANALYRQGHLTSALSMFGEALAHYESAGDTVGRWQTLRFIGQAHLLRSDYEDARDALERARVLAGELGHERLIAQTWYWIGQLGLADGDLDGARAAVGAVAGAYPDGAGLAHAYALHGLGDLARRTGDYARAGQCLAKAADLARLNADATLEGRALLSLAALRQAQRQPGQQAEALNHAATVFAGCGAAHFQARALSELAEALAARGDETGADGAWAQIEALYRAAGVPAEDRMYQRPGS